MPLPPKPWPETEPGGLPFPYSHFGDPQVRVNLLQSIARTLDLQPKLIINLGSGFDVTPDMAFPNAETVHVDDDSQIVRFLGRVGFTAYTTDELPTGLRPDLAMNILGGQLDGFAHRDLQLTPGGSYITTEAEVRDLPDYMTVLALVDNDHTIITDPVDVAELWGSEAPIHLGVYTPDRSKLWVM
jgi:hypothetical protein